MALTNAEKCRRYRRRCYERNLFRDTIRDTMPEIIQMLKEAFATPIATPSRARASRNLPSEDESYKQEGSKKEREREQARLARLEAWTPNDAHRRQADSDGHDVERQAEMYRCQQANAKLKHKDFDRGFMKWLLNAPAFEGNGNGNGHRQAKLSPVDKLWLGAARAAEAVARRERARNPAAKPLLDC